MNRARLVGIGLVGGIALTWLLFAGYLAWSINRLDRRAYELGGRALDRVLETRTERLDMLLRGIEQDLMQQAAAIIDTDTLQEADAVQAWLPLLKAGKGIRAIGLASETGDDMELRRTAQEWRLTHVWEPLEAGNTLVTTWPLDSAFTASSVQIGQEAWDARESTWFSQALDVANTGATWSFSDPSAPVMLFASTKVHERSSREAYRILRFEVEPGALHTAVQGGTTVLPVLLSGVGRPFHIPAERSNNMLSAGAIAGWTAHRSRTAFRFNGDEQEHIARFIPYILDGTTMTVGVVMPMAPISEWITPERRLLWTAAVLLVILGVLLTIALMRGLRSSEEVRQQEKRSRNQQRALARAMDEREVLDREVHHRVKNNLQVVSSLLNLQAQRIAGPDARAEFIRGKRRIDSMALVHHKLYTQKDLANIDLRLFLTQVSNSVSAMHEPQSRAVSHAVETHDIRADADTAIQLGVILCELMGNCYQHAFPYVTGGHVDIEVDRRPDDRYVLSVTDNGRGMGAPGENSDGLGLEIVEGLAGQIDGTVTRTGNYGTRVEVTFRMQGRARVRPV